MRFNLISCSAASIPLTPAEAIVSLITENLLPLELLAAGQKAEVCQLVGTPGDVHRLEELGLRAGTTIEMIHPGSPCIIRLSGHKLCFRDGEAFRVLVRPGAVA